MLHSIAFTFEYFAYLYNWKVITSQVMKLTKSERENEQRKKGRRVRWGGGGGVS